MVEYLWNDSCCLSRPVDGAFELHGLYSDLQNINFFADWKTFDLESSCRQILSYEITFLGPRRSRPSRLVSRHMYIEPTKGVGDLSKTIVLDMSRSGILLDGDLHPLKGLSMKEGTVIRSANFGKK